MYGDKFCIVSRYILVADGPTACTLHLAYTVIFDPSFTRMLRPVVQKGVEGVQRHTHERHTHPGVMGIASSPRTARDACLL